MTIKDEKKLCDILIVNNVSKVYMILCIYAYFLLIRGLNYSFAPQTLRQRSRVKGPIKYEPISHTDRTNKDSFPQTHRLGQCMWPQLS